MYNVEGFLFEDKVQAEEAKKEAEGVCYIKEHTSLDEPEIVLKLYNRLIDRQLFYTPIGINFLCELRLILMAAPEIEEERIQAIPVLRKEEYREAPKSEPKQQKKGDKKDYKKAFHIAVFFAGVFAVSILGMFLIMKVSENNVNIINYRNRIINEYEEWEKKLEEKEAYLEEWEDRLTDSEE
uniref:hypothetical protein n=1 Tax=Agathobacter sp. TaxID=2021311 RepID=UPI004055C546